MADRAAAMQRKNEERKMREEMKAAEQAAQQKLDQQLAKEEFEKHLEEMERLKRAQVRLKNDWKTFRGRDGEAEAGAGEVKKWLKNI
jgi:hypothetical protein